MSDYIETMLPDVPGIHVTTGRGEVYHFTDDGNAPEVTGLAAAVLITRLRWWADWIELRSSGPLAGLIASQATTDPRATASNPERDERTGA